MRWVWILAVLVVLVACSSSGGGGGKSYKTITCADYTALVNSGDAVTNGALTIASDYMSASPVDPKGGASDAADFADQIVAACETTTGDRPIVELKPLIVNVFLAKHPRDKIG
jgi:hypothetical protein